MFTAIKRTLLNLTPLFTFFLFALFIYSATALAQAVGVDPVIVAPSQDEWAALMASLGGLKGASSLVVAGVVVQGLMLLLRSKLGEMAGKYRLVAVSLLTFVGGLVALSVAGVKGPALFLHSGTLLSFQVLLNQVMKQFFTPKGDQV